MDFREADRLISAEWAANNEQLRDAQTKRSRLMVEVEAADGDIGRLQARRDELSAALVKLREPAPTAQEPVAEETTLDTGETTEPTT